MQQSDQAGRTPKGPTTGPIQPLIVVVETTAEDDDHLDAGDQPSPQQPQDDDEQDRLPPVPQQDPIGSTPPPPAAPDGPDDPTPPPSSREPKALPLPVVSAPRMQPPLPALVAATVGISIILFGVAIGILLATNPTSLGPLIGWLPGLTPTASVTLTPAHRSLHATVPITAVTGTPDPTKRQVSARLLTVTSSTFTQTVPTTGHGHTQAAQAHGTLSLLVDAQGTWGYQFSSTEISQVSRRIAGLPRPHALHLLKQNGHIQTVSITETWNATDIPTDPAHIQIMVLDIVNG
jgi:hypothetical protein